MAHTNPTEDHMLNAELGIALHELLANAHDALAGVLEDPASSPEFVAQVAADVAALHRLVTDDGSGHAAYLAYT